MINYLVNLLSNSKCRQNAFLIDEVHFFINGKINFFVLLKF